MSARPSVETAIIVAGGQSKRMGVDKALIPWLGYTLLEHVYRVCRVVGLRDVLIVGREQPEGWQGLSATFLPDEVPHLGPLGGAATGLEYVRSHGLDRRRRPRKDAPPPLELALILACDLPLLNDDALFWLMRLAARCRREDLSGAAAVTPADGKAQPLFAVYSTALLPAVRARLDSGQRSLARLIESEELLLEVMPERVAERTANVNTPEEFERVTRAFAEAHNIPRGIRRPPPSHEARSQAG